jgi:hypothetical protein
MKKLRYYILFEMLMFSGNIFSQKYKSSELLGTWIFPIENDTAKWTFKNDGTLLQEDTSKVTILYFYKFYIKNNKTFFSIQGKEEPKKEVIVTYSIKNISKNSLVIAAYKLNTYDSAKNKWIDLEISHKKYVTLPKMKDN